MNKEQGKVSSIELRKQQYPELVDLSERTKEVVTLFQEIAREAREKSWGLVFISGLAVDAHFGYLTRQHRDVDAMVLRDAISDVKSFLELKGHVVNERGEGLKIDPTDPEHPAWSHGDIHYYYADEKGDVIIPHDGKELKFTAPIEELTEELSFLGESAKFLKSRYLLEEKAGWTDQVGFRGTEENEVRNAKEVEKINFLIEN